ncbi:MAG: alpha/beta fold hydrolase, partial [Solirubrobacteraceae bacterium]
PPHVRKWLPGAEQVTIQSCGHVPQVERPEETNDLLMRFIARSEISITQSATSRGHTGGAGRQAA